MAEAMSVAGEKCPSCGSPDRNVRNSLWHPIEKAVCFHTWHSTSVQEAPAAPDHGDVIAEALAGAVEPSGRPAPEKCPACCSPYRAKRIPLLRPTHNHSAALIDCSDPWHSADASVPVPQTQSLAFDGFIDSMESVLKFFREHDIYNIDDLRQQLLHFRKAVETVPVVQPALTESEIIASVQSRGEEARQERIERNRVQQRAEPLAVTPSEDAQSANFVSEVRPRPDDPSCHVCGALMVPKGWKCLSRGTTTGPVSAKGGEDVAHSNSSDSVHSGPLEGSSS
jgi:hypothetical protein